MQESRRPCFVDVFSSSSSSERLEIPLGFVKYLEGKTSGSVSLIGPSGNTWRVDLIQRNDGLLFGCGWEVFVRDHVLDCGDILVFRYDGEFYFTVKVFDQSRCEKDAVSHSKCGQEFSLGSDNVGKKREREVASVFDQDSGGKTKKVRGFGPESDWECTNRNQEAEVDISGKALRVLPLQSFGLAGREDLNLRGSGCLSASAKYEEKKIAQSFTSSFPFFVRIMKRFNVGGSYTLNVPYKFAMEHFPDWKTEIVLRNVKGVYWIVNSVPSTNVHTKHTFCGGWSAFVRSNDIKFGDVCIFELVGKFELRVRIFRVGKDDLERKSGQAASKELNVGSAASSKKKSSSKIQLNSKKKRQISDLLDETECVSEKSASQTLCSLSKVGNKKPGKTEAGNGGLRKMFSLNEEKAAHSFASSFPYFVRIMKKFNISGSYTLKVPHKFSMAHLPDCKTEIVLRNLQGECWTVNSVPDSKGRAVHTICGGWMSFVRDNHIKLGHVCIFELVSKSEMRVHISGAGRDAPDNEPATNAGSTNRGNCKYKKKELHV